MYLDKKMPQSYNMFVSWFQKGLQEAYLIARLDHSMNKLHITSKDPAITKYPVPDWKFIVHLIVHYSYVIDKYICIVFVVWCCT